MADWLKLALILLAVFGGIAAATHLILARDRAKSERDAADALKSMADAVGKYLAKRDAEEEARHAATLVKIAERRGAKRV